jgi:hypothetical protein
MTEAELLKRMRALADERYGTADLSRLSGGILEVLQKEVERDDRPAQ